MRRKLEFGELELTMHAIRKLVYFAVMESYGPVNIESESFFGKFFGKEEERIKVEEKDNDQIIVDLYLDIEYGVKVTEVARNIIDNVKHKLKEIGGIDQVKVSVHVTGVK